MHLTLSVEMQRILGCVIGEHVSAETPWTDIKKEQLQTCLMAERVTPEISAVKEPLMVSHNYEKSVCVCVCVLHQHLGFLLHLIAGRT